MTLSLVPPTKQTHGLEESDLPKTAHGQTIGKQYGSSSPVAVLERESHNSIRVFYQDFIPRLSTLLQVQGRAQLSFNTKFPTGLSFPFVSLQLHFLLGLFPVPNSDIFNLHSIGLSYSSDM